MTRRALLATAMLIPVAACSSPTPRPAGTATAAASNTVAGGCDARFTLQNRTTTSISEFYFRPAGATDWGGDRFGSRLLGRGMTMSFRVTGEGRHDLRIVWANGRDSRLDNVNLCEVPLIVADNDRLIAPSGPPSPAARAAGARGAGTPGR